MPITFPASATITTVNKQLAKEVQGDSLSWLMQCISTTDFEIDEILITGDLGKKINE